MAQEKTISYSIRAEKAFQAQLKRAAMVTNDLRVPLRLIAIDFYKSQKAIFNLKGPGQYPDFKGLTIGERREADAAKRPNRIRPYEPRPQMRKISAFDGFTPYQYFKQRKAGLSKGYPLLKFTGALEESVTKIGGGGNITEINKDSLILGTEVDYAAYHNSDAPRSKIPLRKFLFIGPESREFASNKDFSGRLGRWNNILNDFVLKQMAQELGAQVKAGK